MRTTQQFTLDGPDDLKENDFKPDFGDQINAFVRLCQSYRNDYKLFKNTHDLPVAAILQVTKWLSRNEHAKDDDYRKLVLVLMFGGLAQYIRDYHPRSKKLASLLSGFFRQHDLEEMTNSASKFLIDGDYPINLGGLLQQVSGHLCNVSGYQVWQPGGQVLKWTFSFVNTVYERAKQASTQPSEVPTNS